jgi:hypothetical protein
MAKAHTRMSHTRLHKSRVYKQLLRDNYTRNKSRVENRDIRAMLSELTREGLVD